MIDEHGRVFGKFSVIDLLVVLVILVVGAALYVKFNVLEVTSAAAKDPISYTITIYGARDYTLKGLKIGDAIYDKNGSGGNTVGTITDIKVADSKKASELLDGTVVMGDYEDHIDITLTISATGTISDGRYLVNKTYEVNRSSTRTYYTKYCTFEATISEIL
jgi:hypothetical protein